MKLRWSVDSGGSEKQVTDALRVFEVRHKQLALAYMDTWASQLGVEKAWEDLKANARLF